jgi:DNA transformation protein
MGISDLKNLGPAMERYLGEIGITTAEQLDEVGSVEAYVRLRERFPRTINLVALYALEGALLDVHWNHLPPEVKAEIVEAAGVSSSGRPQPPSPRRPRSG